MLLGRQDELSAVLEACRSAVAGRGSVLIVTGEPGIGKTALLAEALRAEDRWDVLRATGVEAESAVPYAALQALLWPVRDAAEGLDERQATLLRGIFELGPAVETSPFAVGAAALSLLSVAGEKRPLVMLVDDAQWTDLASQEALRFIGRRLEHERLALLAGVRDGEPCLLVDERSFLQLHLERLGQEAARELLGRVSLAPSAADWLLETCAGNPLGLIELPTLLTDDQRAGESPLPSLIGGGPLVQEAFAARAGRLSDEGRETLLLVAAAGDAEQSLLLGAGSTAAAIDELESAALVRRGARIELRHPLVRAAVYGSATPAERRSAHQRLAEETEGARRAWHLAAAAEGADEHAAQALEDAAVQARHAGGVAAEAQALERAAELSADDHARARRLLGASYAWRRAGRDEHAEALAEQALLLADDVLLRVKIQLERASQVYHRSDWDAAYRLASAAIEDASAVDSSVACRVLIIASQARVLPGHIGESKALAERALELAGETEEIDALSTVVASRMQTRTPPEARDLVLVARAAELLRRSELRAAAEEGAWIAFTLALHERDEEARGLSDLLLEESRATGNILQLTYRLCARAALEQATGRLDTARAFATENLALSEDYGASFRLAEAQWVLAEIESGCGNLDAAERAVGGMETETEWHRVRLLGLPTLAAGNAGEAIPLLERFVELTDIAASRAWFHHAPLELAEAYALAGRAREAEAILRREAPEIEGCSLVRPRAKLARVQALLAPEARIDVAFSAALALLQDVPHLLEEARVELCWGERLRRAGRAGDAVSHLERALARFDALGAGGWAERTRGELEAATGTARPSQPRRTDVLTPQELRIATHAASGLRDREIAATLYLSPRTVESHLQHAYRKLAVTNRTQLAAVLAADGVRPVQ